MTRRALLATLVLTLALAGCADGAVVDPSQPPRPESTTAATEPSTSPAETETTPATPGARGSDALLVVGDWGDPGEAQTEIAARMEAYAADHPIAAILTTGDNLYVDDGDEALTAFAWAERSGIDFWLTWGNHDVESRQRIEEVNRAFSNPPIWTTMEWGGVSIVILDSNDVESEEQIDYLEAEMARIEAPTIVVFHHPPFSCSSHDGNDEVWEEWLPRFDDDVVLVLSGHAHTYQRFDEEGVQYVVTGGGGRGLHDMEECTQGVSPVVGVSEFHFLTLTQGSDDLALTSVSIDGETIDEVSIPLQPVGGEDQGS